MYETESEKVFFKEEKVSSPQNKTKKTETENNTSSTSHKKVTDVNLPDSSLQKEAVEGYRLLEMSVFAKLVCDLLCPECYESQLSVSTDTVKRKGLAPYVSIKCKGCGFSREEYSSPVIEKEGKGQKAFDVNIRSVYAMRSCGQGYNALENLCGIMNLPPPVTKNNYSKLSHTLRDAARVVAEASMSDAIKS